MGGIDGLFHDFQKTIRHTWTEVYLMAVPLSFYQRTDSEFSEGWMVALGAHYSEWPGQAFVLLYIQTYRVLHRPHLVDGDR